MSTFAALTLKGPQISFSRTESFSSVAGSFLMLTGATGTDLDPFRSKNGI